MTSFPVLDVALGLAFVYFLLSVLATALTEGVAALTKQRSRKLEAWLVNALSQPGAGNAEQLVDEFKNSPTYKALQLSAGGRAPSYIPAAHFIDGVAQAAQPIDDVAAVTVKNAAEAWTGIGTDLVRLKGTHVGDGLLGVYRRANGDAIRFRHDAEAWFDDQMERLSGEYKRWATKINALLGLAMVVALNANTVRIVQLLWTDPAARSSVVAGAGSSGNGHISTDGALSKLQGLPLPLGWGGGWTQSGYHGALPILYALFGALLTLAAISLGAPFWFDTLSKLARIRTTGSPPAVTGGTRRGEGDQQRSGPAATTPAPLVATPDAAATAASTPEVQAARAAARTAAAKSATDDRPAAAPPGGGPS